MRASSLQSLLLVMAAILFAFHFQAMGQAQSSVHQHAASQTSHLDQDPCASGCCKNSACCVQAMEVVGYEVRERRSPVFAIASQRTLAPNSFNPPDPPPRSPVV